MGHRGRKSSASLTVVKPGDIVSVHRPLPPEDLNPEQAIEWQAIVDRMPADWFPRETHGLLAQYCRHVTASKLIASLIEGVISKETLDIKKYDRLLRMQEREGRAISSLATRMRISQHSQYDKKKGKGTSAKRPWEG